MNTTYKKESLVIFACIVTVVLFYFGYFIFKNITPEPFLSNNDKRNKMIKIYRNSDILDPNELPNINPNYDDDNNDPDSSYAYDPDTYTPDSYDIDSNRNRNRNSNSNSNRNSNSNMHTIYDPYTSIGYGFDPYVSRGKLSHL
jgi:hypothetical protein